MSDREYLWNSGWKIISYVDVGQEVWIAYPYSDHPSAAVKVTVAVAAGYQARVINKKYSINTWVHIRDMRIRCEKDS